MLRAVVGIVIVATMVGAMMPARTPKNVRQQASTAAEPWFGDESSRPAARSQGWGGSSSAESSEVRLTRHANGHFYADVDVNGTAVEFMIDTGATGIALTAEDARRAGVALDMAASAYVGEGAGGALTGQRVTLDRVKLGSRASSQVQAVVIDGASTNLLGQSFLSSFQEVNVRGDVMTLR